MATTEQASPSPAPRAPGFTPNFFSEYSVVDGVLGWESAWPQVSEGVVNVSDSKDQTALQAAHAAGKVYMMRQSPYHTPPATTV